MHRRPDSDRHSAGRCREEPISAIVERLGPDKAVHGGRCQFESCLCYSRISMECLSRVRVPSLPLGCRLSIIRPALEGRVRTAAQLLSSSEALHEEIGAGVAWWAATRNERTLTAVRTQLEEAALAEAWEQGQALTVDDAIALALDSLE